MLSTPCSTWNSVTTISGFLTSSVKLHRRRTIAGKLLAFGFVAKIVTTHCRLGLLPAAQNFLASIWPLIEILRSLVLFPLLSCIFVKPGIPGFCPHTNRFYGFENKWVYPGVWVPGPSNRVALPTKKQPIPMIFMYRNSPRHCMFPFRDPGPI